MTNWALFVLLSCVGLQAAEVMRYPSGLMQSYTATQEVEREGLSLDATDGVDTAFQNFLKANFEDGAGGLSWQLVQEDKDNTHLHRLYRLMFAGRPVLNQFVKLHYNRKGFIEFATSSWSARFLAATSQGDQAKIVAQFQKQIQARYGVPLPALKSEMAFLFDPQTKQLKPVMVFQSGGKHPAAINRWVIDELNGKTIDERAAIRYHSPEPERNQTDARTVENYAGTNNCYFVSPPVAGGTAPLSAGDHLDLTSQTPSSNLRLLGPYLEVRRGRNNGDPVDVKVVTDYTGIGGWDGNDPDTYTATCNSTVADACPNQAFDAQNVHVHLSNYRKKMIDYLNIDLGTTTCGGTTCFPADPLRVIVNAQPISAGSSTISSNNAAFIPNCSIFSYSSCLVFFKPAAIDGTSCGGTSVTKLFSVAREANVVVHEFQHYITDSITHIAFATSSTLNVGDALHEGYSDYFAASHVVANSGGNAFGAKILGYSFKNCPAIIRDVAVPRVYKVDSAGAAHYDVGLTWASGLYQLRSEFDTVKNADLLALKSQFFLTPTPGYIEAVEALVKADQSLFNGDHVTRIRQLFYTDLKFINGQDSPFRNTESLVAEVGFHSCTSLASTAATNPLASLGAFGLWLTSVLTAGRIIRRRKPSAGAQR